MNARNAKLHLSSDELAKAVVDRDALPADRQAHLTECPSCTQQLSHFQRRLTNMGRMARQTAPAPTRPFRLPQKAGTEFFGWRKSILSMGIAAALLLAVVVWRPVWLSTPQTPSVASFDAAKDRQLMEDIDAIIDNALPAAYQQVASFDTPDLTDDADTGNDPFDWIVPSLQEDEEDDFLT